MANPEPLMPESTAARVALWRAMHVQVDAPPHVLTDEIGLKLVAPDEGWRQRPDMDPRWTARFRASIVARARFVEDLLIELMGRGVRQYVILGAGIDTFAQRRPDLASTLKIFEVDQPAPQAWKRQRLIDLGFGVPDWLKLVPVNFEARSTWWEQMRAAGFDPAQPAFVVSTGVTMYISKEASEGMLREIARLASGTTLAMTFMLPLDQIEPDDQPGFQAAERGARTSGTPFISFYRPEEMVALAGRAGLREARQISTADMIQRYFAGRSDGLRPSSGEHLLIATV